MKLARLWVDDGRGQWMLDPDLLREEKADDKVLQYLRSGHEVLREEGMFRDFMDPEKPEIVPMIYRTDGAWVWNETFAYYLENYGILPQKEFLEEMESHDYAVPEISPETMQMAREAVGAF